MGLTRRQLISGIVGAVGLAVFGRFAPPELPEAEGTLYFDPETLDAVWRQHARSVVVPSDLTNEEVLARLTEAMEESAAVLNRELSVRMWS